jgi:outer membrane protein TolC
MVLTGAGFQPRPRRCSELVSACAVVAFAVIGAAASGPAGADPMRLEDAIGATLSNPQSMERESNNVQSAGGVAQEAAGAFDWNAAAETGWERLYVLQTQNGNLNNGLQSVDVARLSVGVTKEFRDGIEVGPGITTYFGGASDAQAFGATKTLPVLGIKVPLLRGLGEDVADANEIAAQEALSGAKLDLAFAADRAAHDAAQAYWRCAAAFDHMAVLDGSIHDAEAYVVLLRQEASNGAIEPMTLQRYEADLVTRRVNRNVAEEAIQSCQADLIRLTGRSPEQSPPVPTTPLPLRDGIVPPELTLSESEAIDIARQNRKDLAALRRADAAETVRLRGARDGLNPRIDLLVDPTRISLRFTRSLQQDIEEGKIAQAVAAESNARVNLEQLETKMESEITNAMRHLRQSRASVIAMDAAARMLEATVTAEEQRAQANESDREQFRAAQDQLAQLRHQIIDASLDYAANLASLRLALGTLDVADAPQRAALASLFVLPPTR